MHRFRKSFGKLTLALAVGGSVFQLGGCDLLGLATGAITSINPCGTLLLCDPAEYAFVNSGITGPGVRPDLDPFCTYPPFCSTAQDPIFGGLSLFGP